MLSTTGNCSSRKRKASAGSSIINPPRFISFSLAERSVPINPSVPSQSFFPPPNGQGTSVQASFSNLPHELFCNVISFLGPTSSSLCSLHQVNRDQHAKLTVIGDIMLQRAQLRFRTPLPPLCMHESSISLFIRHARASKIVHDVCEILDSTLQKHFPVINPDNLDENTNRPSYVDTAVEDVDSVKPADVNHALNTALCLLGAGKRHYFEDPQRAHDISESAATTALEWRVYSLCSRLGAKAYKYAKSRMCCRYNHEDFLYTEHYAAVTDEMPLDDSSDGDFDEDDDDFSIDPSEIEIDEDVSLLEKASMVLQLVVLQDAKIRGTKHRSQAPTSSALNSFLLASK